MTTNEHTERAELIARLKWWVNNTNNPAEKDIAEAAAMLESQRQALRPLTDGQFVRCIETAGFKSWDSRMLPLMREIIAEFCRVNGITGEAHPEPSEAAKAGINCMAAWPWKTSAEQAKEREAAYEKCAEICDAESWSQANNRDQRDMANELAILIRQAATRNATPPAQPAREWVGLTDGQLARKFHEVYERLAPSFGYETRKETRQFDPSTPNGKLMVAVCGELLNGLTAEAAEQREQEQAVYLVATGEIHEGQETYTRHDVCPPLCDAETLYTTPPTPPAGVPDGWQPIETAPKDGYMLVHEDGAIRALLRIKGVWHKPGYPALIDPAWGAALVGDDAKRILPAGYRLELRDGCCENPTHWMPIPAAPKVLPAAPQPAAQTQEREESSDYSGDIGHE